MKKFNYLWGVILLCLSGCNESDDLVITTPVIITESAYSRSTLSSESLPEGSVVLFHAAGSLTADNLLLTYSNQQWEGEDSLYWNDSNEETTYTALYPVYEDLSYSAENLYTDNELEDVLIAQDTLPGRQKIELSFRHLFSQLVIHVSSSLQQSLEEIRLTVPISVTGISAETGGITTSSDARTIVLPQNESGDYLFILPPMKDGQLGVELVTSEGNYNKLLPAYTFESNLKYECNIRTPIGIRNAEDLIAFSLLINKKSYSGEKTLNDFGEKVGNDTVFYLLADIELTSSECAQLLPIGYHANYSFNYIFDGKNHTISNLTVPDKSTNSNVQELYSGLFGNISSTGIVRNLHISNSQSVSTPTCKQTGILAAVNAGSIMNCSVEGATIKAGDNSMALGFICAKSSGSIINCYTTESSMKVGISCKCGGIAGDVTGHLLNCYALNNTYTTKSTSYTGGIAGMSNINVALTLANCYVYHAKSYTNFGAIIGNIRNATADYVFYNIGSLYTLLSQSTITNAYKYDSSFQVDSILISTYLNEWIESEGKNNYPDISFRKWKTSEEGSVTFE